MARSMEAIVLAAGSGSRLGGPKWAIEVAGAPLVLLHVARLAEAGCARILVIARPERVDELSRLHPGVLASSAEEPSGSLAVGVRALASTSPEHLVWITPVDVLPAKLTTLKSLEAALGAPGLGAPGLGSSGIEAASPRHAGRGGHPVLLRSSALEPYRRGEPPTLRALLEGLGPRRLAVPVDDPAVLGDLDTPGDVLRATGAPLCFARER